MKFVSCLAGAVVALLSASAAFAQSDEGVYVSGFVGGAFLQDVDFVNETATGGPITISPEYQSSVYFGGAIGYATGKRFFSMFRPRIEAEVSYFKSDIEGGAANGVAQTFNGDQDTVFVLLNSYADLITSDNQRFKPYIGGGLGVARVSADATYQGSGATAPLFALSGEDTGFVGHGAIGASFAMTERLELYSEARYVRVFDVELDRRAGVAGVVTRDLEDNLSGFTVAGGLRWRF